MRRWWHKKCAHRISFIICYTVIHYFRRMYVWNSLRSVASKINRKKYRFSSSSKDFKMELQTAFLCFCTDILDSRLRKTIYSGRKVKHATVCSSGQLPYLRLELWPQAGCSAPLHNLATGNCSVPAKKMELAQALQNTHSFTHNHCVQSWCRFCLQVRHHPCNKIFFPCIFLVSNNNYSK